VTLRRIGTITQSGNGFRKGESGTFGIGEIGSVSPGGNREKTFIDFIGFPEAKVHIHADAAAIDLAGAEVNQAHRFLRHTTLFSGLRQGLQGLNCARRARQIGNDRGSHVEKRLIMDAMAKLDHRWNHHAA